MDLFFISNTLFLEDGGTGKGEEAISSYYF